MPLSGDTLLFASIGVAGFLAGVFITMLFTLRRKPKKEPEPELPNFDPVPDFKPEPIPTPPPLPVIPPRHPDEAHLWRDPATGKILAEVDGVEFANPRDLSPDQRRKLVGVLREVAIWFNDSGQKPVKTAAAVRPEPQAAAPTPPAPAPVQADPTATIYVEPRKTGSLPPFPGEKPPDVKKTAPFSIVTQIDAILQGMVQDSPMKAKGIRLVEDASGGVTVWVGVHRYPGIDAVTDPEALAVIRAAVAEWERQSGA
jgi:hypothetical protein